MTRECHVRFYEGLGAKFPGATRLGSIYETACLQPCATAITHPPWISMFLTSQDSIID
jgi:hypothetical protein